MKKAKGSTVKHTAIYGAFRKALEALEDWPRPETCQHRPEVGSNVCPECILSDAHLPNHYIAFPHNTAAANCRKAVAA